MAGSERGPGVEASAGGPACQAVRLSAFQPFLRLCQITVRTRVAQKGFSVATPVGRKSLTLPVTTVAPYRSAVAAIIRSAPL